MKVPTFLLVTIPTLAATTAAHADLLVYDGFGVGTDAGQYTDGAGIDGQGHGVGWSGEWIVANDSANYVTEAGAIAPGNLVSQDGVLVRAGGNSESLGIGRAYTTTFGGANPTMSEAWFSFGFQRNVHNRQLVINPITSDTDASAGQFFGLSAANGSDQLVARIRYGNSSQIETSASAFTVTLGVEYFVVGQVLFNESGTQDVFNVYVLDADGFTGTLPGSPTMSVAWDFDNSFNAWALSTQNPQNNTDVLVLDEFRIGDSFADVAPIPEPASLALLLAGAGLVAARRA